MVNPYAPGTVLSAVVTLWTIGMPVLHAADSPVRGNPLDTVPQLPAPAQTPAPAPAPSLPSSGAAQNALDRTIVPRQFDVSGVHAMDFQAISAILEPLAGRPITLRELVRQTDRITALYREAGYALSFALIQAQDFQDGLVRVTVVEGHITALRVDGDAGPVRARLDRYAAPLLADKPLRRATLERALNLMASLPGVRIRPELPLPQRADGATELVLHATHTPLRIEAGISNLGTGTHAIISATASSLTPLAEQVQLMTAVPRGRDDLEYYAASATVPIGADGLSAKVEASSYGARPQTDPLRAQQLERQVRNQRVGASVSYPFILANQQALVGTAGFHAAHNRDTYRSTITGAQAELENHLRVARVELAYVQSSDTQSRRLAAALYKGLDALNARQRNTPGFEGYDLDFTRITLNAAQTVSLPRQFGLALAAMAQYSNDILPTSEQATFGGQRFGRGYPAGELGGDKGWGVSLEINRLFPVGLRYLASVQPYVAVDHARASLNNPRLATTTDTLTSVALGLRLTDRRYYAFDLNVAKPVGDHPVNRQDRPLRFNASYSLRFD